MVGVIKMFVYDILTFKLLQCLLFLNLDELIELLLRALICYLIRNLEIANLATSPMIISILHKNDIMKLNSLIFSFIVTINAFFYYLMSVFVHDNSLHNFFFA